MRRSTAHASQARQALALTMRRTHTLCQPDRKAHSDWHSHAGRASINFGLACYLLCSAFAVPICPKQYLCHLALVSISSTYSTVACMMLSCKCKLCTQFLLGNYPVFIQHVVCSKASYTIRRHAIIAASLSYSLIPRIRRLDAGIATRCLLASRSALSLDWQPKRGRTWRGTTWRVVRWASRSFERAAIRGTTCQTQSKKQTHRGS